MPIGPVSYPGLSTGLFAASSSGKPARSLYRVLERRKDSTVVEVSTKDCSTPSAFPVCFDSGRHSSTVALQATCRLFILALYL